MSQTIDHYVCLSNRVRDALVVDLGNDFAPILPEYVLRATGCVVRIFFCTRVDDVLESYDPGSGVTINYGAKLTSQVVGETSPLLFQAGTFTRDATDPDLVFFSASLDLNTEEFAAAFSSDSTIALTGSIEIVEDGLETPAAIFEAVGIYDVLRDSEAPPTSAVPAYPLTPEASTLLGGSSSGEAWELYPFGTVGMAVLASAAAATARDAVGLGTAATPQFAGLQLRDAVLSEWGSVTLADGVFAFSAGPDFDMLAIDGPPVGAPLSISLVNLTAPRVVLLPDASGTVVLSTTVASQTSEGVVELATPAEAVAGTDGARAVTPEALVAALMNLNYLDLTGASAWNQSPASPAAGAALNLGALHTNVASPPTAVGWIAARFGSNSGFAFRRGENAPNVGFAFNADVRIDFRAAVVSVDAASTWRVTFGKNFSSINGALVARGFGVRRTGTGALELICHNGTTATSVASSPAFTPTTGTTFDVSLRYVTATGTVALWVNDVKVAEAVGGVGSGASALAAPTLWVEIENTATAAAQSSFTVYRPKLLFAA